MMCSVGHTAEKSMSRIPSSSSRFRIPRKIRPKPRTVRKAGRAVALFLLAIVVAFAIHQVWKGYFLQRQVSRPPEVKDYHQVSNRLDEALKQALENLGASPSFAIQDEKDMEEGWKRWRFRHLTVRVTDQIPLLRCNLAITKSVHLAGGQVLSVQQESGKGLLTIELGVAGLRTHLVELISDQNISPTRGNLALIIDDFGAINNQVADAFIRLPIALTVAVIPGHQTSQRVARQAQASGHQVFVHLPMQPKEGELGEENGILVDLPEEEIRRRVRWALAEIPEAVGVNNHMGSLATENESVMTVVLQEIKMAGKFFVDSWTSSQSVAVDVAGRLDLPCEKSEGFLDYQDDGSHIKENLVSLANRALKNGSAIGIGHVKASTLQALEEMIPPLEQEGVRFVHVSRVLEARR
jgi:polysaccharide deacetylase 2 family uncharacterized protein YibQ